MLLSKLTVYTHKIAKDKRDYSWIVITVLTIIDLASVDASGFSSSSSLVLVSDTTMMAEATKKWQENLYPNSLVQITSFEKNNEVADSLRKKDETEKKKRN